MRSEGSSIFGSATPRDMTPSDCRSALAATRVAANPVKKLDACCPLRLEAMARDRKLIGSALVAL
jgi:hypothetical protein